MKTENEREVIVKGKFGLIVIAAPSGTGKSTLCTRLLAEFPDRLALSVSSTSRAPRGQEQHGKEYFFLNAESFQEKIQQNEFAEWALVHGNYYGTSKQTLESFWSNQKHVLLDIDVQGAESLRTAYPDQSFTVFITPPSLEELEQRLRKRGTDAEDTIQKRMKNAITEMNRKHEFDEILVNDVFEVSYQHLKHMVQKFMNQLEAGQWQKRR